MRRPLTPFILLAMMASVIAIPITPAAPELQHLAEQMRSEGMAEHDIAEQLAVPLDATEVQPQPLLSRLSFTLQSFLSGEDVSRKRDFTGDIAPGSLDAPQMLPRAAELESFVDTLKARLWGYDLLKREFAYEGKESEMRRPWGMRHWDPVGYHWE